MKRKFKKIDCKDCNKLITPTSSMQKRCATCQKNIRRAASCVYEAKRRKNNPEKLRIFKAKWRKNNPKKCTASVTRAGLALFLKKLGLPKTYDIRSLISDTNISDEQLKKITDGNGYPDWPKEGLEEKKEFDCPWISQWARAILEYRARKCYRFAFRFSSTRRKVFKNIFNYYDWIQTRAK